MCDFVRTTGRNQPQNLMNEVTYFVILTTYEHQILHRLAYIIVNTLASLHQETLQIQIMFSFLCIKEIMLDLVLNSSKNA